MNLQDAQHECAYVCIEREVERASLASAHMPTTIDDLVTSMSEADFSTMVYGGYDCSICLQSADDDGAAPSIQLHCKHSFCSTCLRSHCLAQLQQQGRAFAPCPLCKTAMRKDEVPHARMPKRGNAGAG